MPDPVADLAAVDDTLQEIDSLLQRVRDLLSSWLDSRIGDVHAVLDTARRQLSTYIDTELSGIRRSREQAQQGLADYTSRILADGATVLEDYGIDIPPVDQLLAVAGRPVTRPPPAQPPVMAPPAGVGAPPKPPGVSPVPARCRQYPQCSTRWIACLAGHGLTPADVGVVCEPTEDQPGEELPQVIPVLPEPLPAPTRPPPVSGPIEQGPSAGSPPGPPSGPGGPPGQTQPGIPGLPPIGSPSGQLPIQPPTQPTQPPLPVTQPVDGQPPSPAGCPHFAVVAAPIGAGQMAAGAVRVAEYDYCCPAGYQMWKYFTADALYHCHPLSVPAPAPAPAPPDGVSSWISPTGGIVDLPIGVPPPAGWVSSSISAQQACTQPPVTTCITTVMAPYTAVIPGPPTTITICLPTVQQPPPVDGQPPVPCPIPPDLIGDIIEAITGEPPPLPPPSPPEETTPAWTGGELLAEAAAPYWGSLDICTTLDAITGQFTTGSPLTGLQEMGILSAQNCLLPLTIDLSQVSGLPSWVAEPLQDAWNQVVACGLGGVLQVATDALQTALTAGNCPVGPMIIPSIMRGLLYLASYVVGPVTGDLAQTYSYQANYYCPTYIPSKAEADLAYLRDVISDELWRCWVRANNFHEEPARQIRDAQREMPTADEWMRGWLRGLVPDTEIDGKLRQLGMLDEDERKLRRDLAYQIPPVSDLPRFMVRDVMDPNIVGTIGPDGYPVTGFGLDADFENKFQGLLRDWAKGQGIGDDVMLAYWRAHWVFPSPTQLYTMLHRLRSDNVPPGTDPARWITTPEHVFTALGVNDILPFWRERLMAVSFNPLTRVDARRAYNLGLLTRPEMVGAMEDIGYTPMNAERLTAFADLQRALALDAHRAIRGYEAATLSSADATFRLTQQGYDPQEIALAIERADVRAQQKVRDVCNKAMRRRYLAGEFVPNDAISTLTSQGLDGAQATRLVNSWECELVARGKHLSASVLCRMLGRGLITIEDMRSRLIRVGYRPLEAELVVADCLAGISERQLRAQEQAARRAAAEARRQKKEEEAAIRRQQQELAAALRDQQRQADRAEREARQLAADIERAERREMSDAQRAALAAARAAQARKRLAERLADAAGELAGRLGLSIPATEELLEEEIAAAAAQHGTDRDTAARYALTALDLIPDEGDVDLAGLVADAVQSGVSGEEWALHSTNP